MPQYKIGNPRGIPEGLHILRWPCHYPDSKTGELAVDEEGNLKLREGMTEDILWYEGDDFECPKGMNMESRLADGVIIEVEESEDAESVEEVTDG